MGMGGVQRTLKFAKYLRDFNWEPVVITDSPKKYFAVDKSLLKEALDSGIIIERTGKEEFNPDSIVTKAPNEKMRKIASRLSQFVLIPDNKKFWKNKALKKIDEVWKKYGGFDVVYSTAPPYTDHLIGLKVKEKYGVPFVADYRDAWVDSDVLNKYSTPFHKGVNIRLEQSVIKQADRVLTTNRRVKELIISRYGNIGYNDVIIYPHGFDPADFEEAQKTELPYTDKMRITYSGSFYTRNPKYYFDAIKMLFEKHPELKNEIEFCFVGNLPKDIMQIIKTLKIEDNINIVGYVDHIESVRYLLASDLLFLLISRGANDDAAMPGKVGEYIGSRKNILACIPEGVTKKMLEKYNAVTFIDQEDPAALSNAMYEYYKMYINKELPAANEEVVNMYDRKKMTEDLAKQLNYLLKID